MQSVTNLSVAYAVCKTKEGGLGGSPKEKSFGTPRVSFSKNLLLEGRAIFDFIHLVTVSIG